MTRANEATAADKTWWCGNCGFSHAPEVKFCEWCGIPPKYPNGLPMEEAIKVKKRRSLPINMKVTAADTGPKKKGQVQQAAVPASAGTAPVAAVPKNAPPAKPSFLTAAKKAIAPSPEETAAKVEAAVAAHAEAIARAAVKAEEEENEAT